MNIPGPTPEDLARDASIDLTNYGDDWPELAAWIRRAVAAEREVREMKARLGTWDDCKAQADAVDRANARAVAAERERDELRGTLAEVQKFLAEVPDLERDNAELRAEAERLNELCSRTVDQIAVWDDERCKMEAEVERLRTLLGSLGKVKQFSTRCYCSTANRTWCVGQQQCKDINAALEAAK